MTIRKVSSLKTGVSSSQESGHLRLQTSDFRLVVLVSFVLIAAAASVLALPWSQDMVRGRAVMPQTQMLTPPANTIAVGGSRILDRVDAEDKLTNPLTASPEVVEEGRVLFQTYCAVCHGADGRAPGPVGKLFPMVADLSSPQIQGYPDGALYSIIREGGFKMPGYAEALSQHERWAVVHFVRTLRP